MNTKSDTTCGQIGLALSSLGVVLVVFYVLLFGIFWGIGYLDSMAEYRRPYKNFDENYTIRYSTRVENILSPDESHIYRFSGRTGDLVTIECDSDQPDINLDQFVGPSIFRNSPFDSLAVCSSSDVTYELPYDEDYFITIENKENSPRSYTFTLTAQQYSSSQISETPSLSLPDSASTSITTIDYQTQTSPIWENATFQFIVGTILTIIGLVLTWLQLIDAKKK